MHTLDTPAVRAWKQLESDLRHTPLYRLMLLQEFECMLRGMSTPYLDDHADARTRAMEILRYHLTPIRIGALCKIIAFPLR